MCIPDGTQNGDTVLWIESELQRECFADALDWIIGFDERSQREESFDLSAESLDASLDRLADVRALQERLDQGTPTVAVPTGIVQDVMVLVAEGIEGSAGACADHDGYVDPLAIERVAEGASLLMRLGALHDAS